MMRYKHLVPVLLIILLSCNETKKQDNPYMDPEYWKSQALTDVLPHWSAKAFDSVNNMFYTNLDRNWKTFGSFDQSPAMIARHLFGYSAGYLMSGDESLIRRADEIKNYLIRHAWDDQYGGWFDAISRTGEPVVVTKTIFNQVYTITGLTLYYFVTKDKEVLSYIERSNDLLEKMAWDSVSGGYFDIMNQDWSVQANTKSFSSEITPVSGYLFYLYLATREEKYLRQTERIMDVVMKHMRDQKSGWILESFDSSWNYLEIFKKENEVNIGHNIETAWMLLRAYLLNGKLDYLRSATELSEAVHRYGFDSTRGVWFANVAKDSSSHFRPLSYWWIQAYGNMFNLILFNQDKNNKHLDIFCNGSAFWDKYFVDKEMGDTYQGVSLDGDPVDPVKANLFKASYHNMENSLLCWLYLSLWVNKEPVTLHFRINSSKEGDVLYPLPVEEKNYSVSEMKIDGKAHDITGNRDIKVTLPELRNGLVKVTLRP